CLPVFLRHMTLATNYIDKTGGIPEFRIERPRPIAIMGSLRNGFGTGRCNSEGACKARSLRCNATSAARTAWSPSRNDTRRLNLRAVNLIQDDDEERL